jgi:tetratricopeptide (TPR) repeat protein
VAECTNKKLAGMLHAYELGLLSDDDRVQFEQHLIECDRCFAEATRLSEAARLLKLDPETRQRVQEVTRPQSDLGHGSAKPRRLMRALIPVAVTIAVVLVLVLKDWRIEITPSDSVLAVANRIAILPFDDVSHPVSAGGIGEVVSDLLITGLSQSASLQVVSSQYLFDLSARGSGSGAEARRVESRDIARRAGARWLLTGTVAQINPSLVITAQLVDVASGTVKTGTTVSAQSGETMFAVADSLSAKVRAALLEPPAQAGRPVAEMTTESPQAYHEYMLGVDSYRRFYRREAEQHFRKALTFDSMFAMPYYYLSLIAPTSERPAMVAAAVRLLDRAGDREQYLIRSRAASAAGNLQEAMDQLAAFVIRYPDEKEPLLQLGAAEYSLWMLPKAVKHLQAAIALDSAYTEAFNQIAYTYSRLGDTAAAFRAVDRYVALAPNDANPYDSRGFLCATNGRLEQAIESYRQALRMRPDYTSSLLSLSVMYGFQQDYQHAESCLVALSKSPEPQTRSSGRLYQSCLAAYRGQFHRALAMIDSAIHADSADGYPEGVATKLYVKAITYEALGKLPEALQAMRECLNLRARFDPADLNRESAFYIRLLARGGRIDEARDLAERLRIAADSAKAWAGPYWMAMGAIAAATSTPDSALFWMERTSNQTPAFYDKLRLAVAYLDAGRLAEAVAALQKLRDCYVIGRIFWAPDGARLHYYLGRAYEESRWNAQASEEYRKFLTIWQDADPGIPEVEDAKTRLSNMTTRHE